MTYDNISLRVLGVLQEINRSFRIYPHLKRKVIPNFHLARKLCTKAMVISKESSKNGPVYESEKYNVINVNNYLQEINPDYLNMGMTCKKVTFKRPSSMWLVSEDAAQKIADLITADLIRNSCDVVELSPGLGLLTKRILNSGIKHIHFLEKDKFFRETIKNLMKPITTTPSIHNNLVSLLKRLESSVEIQEEGVKPALQIICAVPTANYLYRMVFQYVYRIGFMSFGRPIHYCFMYPSIYDEYLNPRKPRLTRTSRVIIQNFFQSKILGTLERSVFLPWSNFPSNYPKNFREKVKDDNKVIYVVKLEPKPHLQIDRMDLRMYRSFLVALLFQLSKQTLLIQTVEKHFPGSGIKLIELNYDMMTRMIDLTDDEYLKIFLELKNQPEFKDTFIACSDTFDNFSIRRVIEDNFDLDHVA